MADDLTPAARLFEGEGEMRARLRAFDWTTSPLGPPQSWSPTLEAYARLLLDARQGMFLAWGPQLAFLYNDAYAPILGGKHPEALGRPFEDIWSDIWEQIRPIVDRTLAGEGQWFEDLLIPMERHGFPEEAWFSFSYTPVREVDGRVAGLFCVATETTEKVLAERRVRGEFDRLRAMFEQAPGLLAVLRGPDHVFEFANAAYERLTGRRDLTGKSLAEAVPEVVGQGYIALLDQVRRTGEPYVGRAMPVDLARTPGAPPERRYVDFVYQPFRDAAGAVDGVFVEGYDVTDAKLAEQSLRQAEERLRDITDAMPVLISYVDADQVFRFANKAYEGRFDRPLDTIVGRKVSEVFESETYALRRPWVERALNGERVVYEAPFTEGGKTLHTVIEHIPHRGPDGKVAGFYSLVQDVTPLKRAAEDTRRLNERLVIAHRAAGAAAWDWDFERDVLTWADLESAKRIFGPGLPDTPDLPLSQWFGMFPPEDLERHHAETGEVLASGEGRVEFRLVMPDGTVRWYEAGGRVVRRGADGGPLEVTGVTAEITERKHIQEALTQRSEALETLNRTAAAVSSELDLSKVVQLVVDAGVVLTEAEFGAFFYNVHDVNGDALMLYALSGADPSHFADFPHPRATAVFAPTFKGEGVIRSEDITADPRYGLSAPYHGMPEGHLPVRSYLAVPVVSRGGDVIGGLFFGHARTGVFTEETERRITGLAGQAAVAMDNARLFEAAERELAERRRAEAHQRLLINELNHRVKNTLATIQSIASQSFRDGQSPAEARTAFNARLMALSRAHDVLTRENWEGADLSEVVAGAVAPFQPGDGDRFDLSGDNLRLSPKTALAVAMAMHELATNAVKYGALSAEGGRVSVAWTIELDGGLAHLRLEWRERGGPPVTPPGRRGFGSRLVERALAADLDGRARIDFPPEGVVCLIEATLPTSPVADAA